VQPKRDGTYLKKKDSNKMKNKAWHSTRKKKKKKENHRFRHCCYLPIFRNLRDQGKIFRSRPHQVLFILWSNELYEHEDAAARRLRGDTSFDVQCLHDGHGIFHTTRGRVFVGQHEACLRRMYGSTKQV
jgi:hypothetical protein